MTTECHYDKCPHHGTNESPPDEGPFCYQRECLATEDQIKEYQKCKDET